MGQKAGGERRVISTCLQCDAQLQDRWRIDSVPLCPTCWPARFTKESPTGRRLLGEVLALEGRLMWGDLSARGRYVETVERLADAFYQWVDGDGVLG